ncbi:hypothetical protein [Gemmatimonas sp.]|uniref:hypothetical protein n=1 Tax=Gemmatimonas sp. TaxID=1962908 RepID=UPI003341B16D
MSIRFVRISVVILVSLLLCDVQSAAAQAAQRPPEVVFAQEYVRALRDSGAAGVTPLTVEETRNRKGYAPNMDALRKNFASPQTTITLDRWSAVPAKGDLPPTFLVEFRVEGIATPLELSLWIEAVAGRYLLNTIMARPIAAKENPSLHNDGL